MDNKGLYPAIPFAFPGVPGVRCLFGLAPGGDMSLAPAARTAVLENRRRFMAAAGFAAWAELHQVHGDALVSAIGDDDPGNGEMPEADGHFTCARRVGLIIKTADCQPIFLARIDGGAIAGLHVGWRGNAANFIGTAVKRLCREFSCSPGDLLAVRGPSLGPGASEFVNFAREWPPEFSRWYDPRDKTVNLWALSRYQLERAGLRPERIFGLDLCTFAVHEWFFSYRRKDSGRQVSAVWRE